VVGAIGSGLLVLLGVASGDREADARALARRIPALRIFPDSNGKMNLDLVSAGGQLLVVSQFTLLADTRGGRRPSFSAAAGAEQARQLYELFISASRQTGLEVAHGQFGAKMEVELINDGPVTLILDSNEA